MRATERNERKFLKENPCIPRKFLPIYNGKETPKENKIMQNLTKEKLRAELQLQNIRYERQLDFIKKIDDEMTNLIKVISMKKLQLFSKSNELNNVNRRA